MFDNVKRLYETSPSFRKAIWIIGTIILFCVCLYITEVSVHRTIHPRMGVRL